MNRTELLSEVEKLLLNYVSEVATDKKKASAVELTTMTEASRILVEIALSK